VTVVARTAWHVCGTADPLLGSYSRTIEQHGSPIIAALEHAWAAIQDVPDVVIVTGAGLT
jgi:hypothetical protein